MKYLLLAVLSFSVFANDDLAKEKAASKVYIDQMASEANAQVLENGVVVRPIFKTTSSEFAIASDTIVISYTLNDREGKLIDNSIFQDSLLIYPLASLISCWKSAITLMPFGSLYKITCPSDTAYGDKGITLPDGTVLIKGGAALTFRVFMHGIKQED